MNANPQFLAPRFTAVAAHVDEAAIKPLPNSRKVYVQGSRPDLLCADARDLPIGNACQHGR